MMAPTAEAEIERYLRAGEYDPKFAAWPGDFVTAARCATRDLKSALVAEIRRRAEDRPPPAALVNLDLVAFTRRKVEPMVRGLFPGHEQGAVLDLLERSVIVLTPDCIQGVLEQAHWLHTAWDLANIYLGSIGAEPLGEEGTGIVGLSEETTCYLSADYFRGDGRFADFLVHETAHIFHNCKRNTIGLLETRTREWLLDIDFRKRETFAYACEAYSRIADLARTRAARVSLVEELARGPLPSDERVEPEEYLDIVREAAGRRNGWKRILSRCAPRRRKRGNPYDGAPEFRGNPPESNRRCADIDVRSSGRDDTIPKAASSGEPTPAGLCKSRGSDFGQDEFTDFAPTAPASSEGARR